MTTMVYPKSCALLYLCALLLWASPLPAATGTITIPYLSNRPEQQPFKGHPGWVDVYAKGHSAGVSARISADGTFEIPDQKMPVCLVAMFDKIETPPVILSSWPVEAGNYNVPIPVEYACVPEGYPDVWDRQYKTRATNFFQTIKATGTQLYGVSVFDGTRMAEWGNQIHVSVLDGGPDGELRFVKDPVSPDPWAGGLWDMMTAGKSHRELPRIGWRHGNMETIPGKTYTIEVSGYRSHGGKNFELDAYVRKDNGDGYPDGEAFADDKPTGGDLCCLVFGDSHGQYVENQIRTEEWETFIPAHRPSDNWGQSFTAHGTSLAGVSFWASSGNADPMTCDLIIREEGPWGKEIKPARTARSHESPARPFVRYPELPARLPGYEDYYKLPCHFFQAAWTKGEVELTPGRVYYIELNPSRPVMVYADGDYYHNGFAYYEDLKVERLASGRATMHSGRWTLAMNLVTYK